MAEAVAKARSAIGSRDDRDRFRPWLLRILRNDIISDCRKWWANPEKVLRNNLPGEKIMAAVDEHPDAEPAVR